MVALDPATVLIGLLVAASAFFSLVAVVGFYRLPDVYARAHAASKSETLGALLGLSAAAVAFGPGVETVRLALLSLFVLVTGPTAAHAIVRSAADAGTTPWTREHPVADGGREDWPPARTGSAPDPSTDGGPTQSTGEGPTPPTGEGPTPSADGSPTQSTGEGPTQSTEEVTDR